jgi:hypothetical protein
MIYPYTDITLSQKNVLDAVAYLIGENKRLLKRVRDLEEINRLLNERLDIDGRD